MKYTFTVILMAHSIFTLAQSAFVEKVVKKERAYLAIGVKNKNQTERYQANCQFKTVTLLPDSIKIHLIGELLNHTADTEMCLNSVYNLSGHYETLKRVPKSKEYNLQIDALILINYIAFSSNAFIYSPYPLLYDKETNKEICCGSQELSIIIAAYKKWYIELKQKGFRNYCYPSFDRKYEWFESKIKPQKIKEYPQWNNFYDCREIE